MATDKKLENLIINEMTYQQAVDNIDSIGNEELIYTTDKVLPTPTSAENGKLVGVVAGDFAFVNGGSESPTYIIQVEWNSSGEATVISENHYAELKAYYDTHNNTLPKVVVDLVGIGKMNLSAYFEAKNMFTMFFHVSIKESGELANTLGVTITNTADTQEALAQMWVSEGGGSPEYEPSHIGCVRLERDASTLEDMRSIYGPDTNWQYIGVESNFHVWVRIGDVPVEKFAVYLSDEDYLFEEAGKQAETGVDYINTIYSNITKEHPTGIDSVTQGDFNLDYLYDNDTGQITIFGTTIGTKTKDDIMINIAQESYSIICDVEGYTFQSSAQPVKGIDYNNQLIPAFRNATLPNELVITQNDQELGHNYDSTTGAFTIYGSDIGRYGSGAIRVKVKKSTYLVYVDNKNYELAEKKDAEQGVNYTNIINKTATTEHPSASQVKAVGQGSINLRYNYNETTGEIDIDGEDIGTASSAEIVIYVEDTPVPTEYNVISDIQNVNLYITKTATKGETYSNQLVAVEGATLPSKIRATQNGSELHGIAYMPSTGVFDIPGEEIGKYGDGDIHIEEVPEEEPEITEFEVYGLEDEYEYGSKIKPTSCTVTITNSSQVAHLWYGLNFEKTQEITITGDKFEFIPDELPPVETDKARITLIGETKSGATITYEGDILTIKNYEYWISKDNNEVPITSEGCAKVEAGLDYHLAITAGDYPIILTPLPNSVIQDEFAGGWYDDDGFYQYGVGFTQANGYVRYYYAFVSDEAFMDSGTIHYRVIQK